MSVRSYVSVSEGQILDTRYGARGGLFLGLCVQALLLDYPTYKRVKMEPVEPRMTYCLTERRAKKEYSFTV